MDILKKQSGVILAYVILVVLLASAECAAENKTLLFVGNDSYPPISYQEGGKPKGLAIDIVRALGQRMGRQIDIRLMEWKVAQAMVAQGKADALCQLSITEPRKKIYDFSDQAHDLRFSIFVRTGKQGIYDLSDLRGLQVAAIAGSVQYNIAMADPQIKFALTTNDIQCFQLLKDGKVDAVLADLWTGSYVLADKGITGIQASGEPFAHLASAIAVKKGNTELLAAINEGLRSLQADGTIERINEKWRPQEIIVQTREQAVRKTYYVIIGILSLLLVVGAFWLITLRREIAERKLAKEAMRESEEKYRTLVENISDVIFEVDGQGMVLYFSPIGKDIWGYDKEDVIGKNFIELVHPDDRNILISRFMELVTGIEYPLTYRLRNKAGNYRWVRTKTKPRIDNGTFIGASGTLIDITDQKKAEEELRESEDKFSKAFQTSPYAITITSPEDGTFIEVNDAFTSMTGFTREEAIAGSSVGLKMWVNEEDRRRVVAALQAGRTVVSQEYLFRTKSGKVITGLFSAQATHLKQGHCILSSINDITERKQTEEALREGEDRYRKLLEVAPVGIAVHIGGKIVFTNPAGVRLLGGTSEEQIVGRSVFQIIHPDNLKAAQSRIQRMLAGEEGLYPVDDVYLKLDGTPINVEVMATPLPYKGNPAVQVIVTDITARKQAAEEKAKLENQLFQAQKMEAIGTLAGGIAHDFNNILGAMLGYTELAMMEADEEGRQKDLSEVLNACKRAAELVKQILSFSRKSDVETKPINAGYIVKEVRAGLEKLDRCISEEIAL